MSKGERFTAETQASVQRVHALTGFHKTSGILLIALPVLVYYMWISITYNGGGLILPTSIPELRQLVLYVPSLSLVSVIFYGSWLILQTLLQIYAPGKLVKGSPLTDGSRLTYVMNGWFSLWVTLGLAGFVVWIGWFPATFLFDQLGPLITTVNLFAFVFSFYLYFYGRKELKGHTRSGRFVYDYFVGTTLNPRVGRFDYKLFFESRPGLILWVLINFSCAAKQLELHGEITHPMMLVCIFQFIYVADYFYNEKSILSTIDIKYENFGWMLCWGSTVWVPFTYTIPAAYLTNHTHELPTYLMVSILTLYVTGYYIFRSTNNQKARFREYPEARIWGKPPESIRTHSGRRLLVSGWWGKARHFNYLGDMIMGLAWCLPCLTHHLLSYFYFIYITWLLLHREWRDNQLCQVKYGEDWEEYCRRVPWRIIPGIY